MIKRILLSMFCGGFLLMAAKPVLAAVSDETIVKMVDTAAAKIVKNAPEALKGINDGDEGYISKEDPDVYVFVYDSDVNIVAHVRPDLVGKNFKGKADPKGKKFRDDIVSQAIAQGKTWVDYMYQKPGGTDISTKTTYAVSAKGSDGKMYVVCAGKYK